MRGIGRVLRVFEHVALHGPIGVSEVARNTDLSKTTAQRYLLSLAEAGWLRPAGESDYTRWEVTPRALLLSQHGSREGALIETARDYMTALRDEVDETITLQIPNNNFETIHLGQVESTQAVRTHIDMGSISPMTVTSGGLAILANLPDEDIERALSLKIPKLTPDTITDPTVIRSYLLQVREDGYAVNRGQNRSGVKAVGAAVSNSANVPVAAIGISVPDTRFDEDKVSWWGARVRETAAQIAKRI